MITTAQKAFEVFGKFCYSNRYKQDNGEKILINFYQAKHSAITFIDLHIQELKETNEMADVRLWQDIKKIIQDL